MRPPAEAARGAAASDLSARTLTAERVVREKCEPNQKTQTQSDLRGSRSVNSAAVVSAVVDTQVEQEKPVTKGSDLGASAPGADAASRADGCKCPAPEMLACSRAAGLHDEAIHNQAGAISSAIKRKICPRPGLDKTRRAELGSAREANGASAPNLASLGQGPRRYKQCLPGRHSDWRQPSRR
ncbi:unnamed protein product [Phytophthora fragariaefolia]|uniref:Unnamed protein product n=1 Tax=Phytophthora fragariaefolia TaxID=1490495 RepID=A0A9W6XRT6_9STRA|nr:unnamed protein product [Phytophthora fragariaefolia]